MKNWNKSGAVLSVTAPYAVDSGAGCLIGAALFGVAITDAANAAAVEIATSGVFSLAKVSAQAWTAGDVIYWDDSAKKCTTSGSGNVQIGIATADAANPSSTGYVILK